jgi:hypothetical protein
MGSRQSARRLEALAIDLNRRRQKLGREVGGEGERQAEFGRNLGAEQARS